MVELTKKKRGAEEHRLQKGRLEFCFVLLTFSINLVDLVDLASSTSLRKQDVTPEQVATVFPK